MISAELTKEEEDQEHKKNQRSERSYNGPVRWLVLVLIWAGWCWFFMRVKHY